MTRVHVHRPTDTFLAISSDTTLSNNPGTVAADASGSSPLIVTLPLAAQMQGKGELTIVNVGATGTVTVDASGAETIAGSLTWNLSTQWESVTLHSVGTGWAFGAELQVDGGGFPDQAWHEVDISALLIGYGSAPISIGSPGTFLGLDPYMTMRYTRIGRYVRGQIVGRFGTDHDATNIIALDSADLPYVANPIGSYNAHASNFGYVGVPGVTLSWADNQVGTGLAHTHDGYGNYMLGGSGPITTSAASAATGLHTHTFTDPVLGLQTTTVADSGAGGITPHEHLYEYDGYLITVGPIITDLSGAGDLSLTFVHFDPGATDGNAGNLWTANGLYPPFGPFGTTPQLQVTPDLTGRAFSINTSFEYEAATIAP